MFDYLLFFGFPLNETVQKEIEKIPEALRALFLNGSDEYLQLVEQEGISYIGKSLGECIDSLSLEMAQVHILSLLKRLLPEQVYEKETLVLLAVPANLS